MIFCNKFQDKEVLLESLKIQCTVDINENKQ
jgi:hypothetical protein